MYTKRTKDDLPSWSKGNQVLNYANLQGANLCGVDLNGARITEAQLSVAKTNWRTVMPSGKRGFW